MSYLDERRKHIEDGRPLPPKKKYTIPKKSEKRLIKEKEQKVEIIKPKKRPKGWFNLENEVDNILVKEEMLDSLVKKFGNVVFHGVTQTAFEVKTDIIKMDEVGTFVVPKDNICMDYFWRYAESVIVKGGRKCWECGDIISKADYRNSIGHIFPKSIFLSVADNIYNFVVVGARCGCHNKTHTLSTFAQMSIFPVAVQRYLKFGHIITEKHKYHDLFLEYANQII